MRNTSRYPCQIHKTETTTPDSLSQSNTASVWSKCIMLNLTLLWWFCTPLSRWVYTARASYHPWLVYLEVNITIKWIHFSKRFDPKQSWSLSPWMLKVNSDLVSSTGLLNSEMFGNNFALLLAQILRPSPWRSCIYSVLNIALLEHSVCLGRSLPCGVMIWAGLAGARTFHVVSVPSEWLHTNCFPSWCQATEWIAYRPTKGRVMKHKESRSGKLTCTKKESGNTV